MASNKAFSAHEGEPVGVALAVSRELSKPVMQGCRQRVAPLVRSRAMSPSSSRTMTAPWTTSGAMAEAGTSPSSPRDSLQRPGPATVPSASVAFETGELDGRETTEVAEGKDQTGTW